MNDVINLVHLDKYFPTINYIYFSLASLSLYLASKTNLGPFYKHKVELNKRTIVIFLTLLSFYFFNIFETPGMIIKKLDGFFDFSNGLTELFKTDSVVKESIYGIAHGLCFYFSLASSMFIYCSVLVIKMFSPLVLLNNHNLRIKGLLRFVLWLFIGPSVSFSLSNLLYLGIKQLRFLDYELLFFPCTVIIIVIYVSMIISLILITDSLSKSLFKKAENAGEKTYLTTEAVIEYSRLTKEQKEIKKLLKFKKLNIKTKR